MLNDDPKADVDISVTDELAAADAGNQRWSPRLLCEPGWILRLSPARGICPRTPDRQGHRRAPWPIGIRASLHRLVFPARGSAPRSDWQPGPGDGGRGG